MIDKTIEYKKSYRSESQRGTILDSFLEMQVNNSDLHAQYQQTCAVTKYLVETNEGKIESVAPTEVKRIIK